MISPWQCQNVLARFLQCLVNLNLLLLEIGWRHHRYDVKKDVWVFLEKQSTFLLDSSLKLLSIVLRHAIPLLRLAPMCVIYRVEHQVFIMPAESRVAHANVEPGNVDARYVVAAWELHQRVERLWEVVQIPRMPFVGLLSLTHYALAFPSEA